MEQKKVFGGIAAGCGSFLVLLSLASAGFFGYVGSEGRGRDEEIAWPAMAGSCCCSLVCLLIVGVGIYLLVSKSPEKLGG